MTEGEKQVYREIMGSHVTNDLREALGHRLAAVFNGEAERINAEEKETGVPWPERYKDDYGLLWRAVADEVIRQMEWARRVDREMVVVELWEPGTMKPRRVVENGPLTLAPENWQP